MINNFEHLHSITYYTRPYYEGIEYVAEIRHKGLSASKVIKWQNKLGLDIFVEAQFSQWDEHWESILQQNNYQPNQFDEVKENLLKLENTLNEAINKENSFDIETLYQDKPFDIENPKNYLQTELDQLIYPTKPQLHILPVGPDKFQFEERIAFFDNLIKSRKEKKIEIQEALYENAIIQWKNELKKVEQENQILVTVQ